MYNLNSLKIDFFNSINNVICVHSVAIYVYVVPNG